MKKKIKFPYQSQMLSEQKTIYAQQNKFLDTSKSLFFPEMFYIRLIKSILWEAGGCLLHFDTKFV